MALPDGLLSDTKNYLDITWDDPDGDKKLSGLIARGIKYLDNTAGKQLNYTIEDKGRELLFDYVRYARSNALDEFQGNYLHELIALQMQTEVPDDTQPTEIAGT
nr:MAG TPA: Head Tail Connector Protein [Caudoviricetes sp.]